MTPRWRGRGSGARGERIEVRVEAGRLIPGVTPRVALVVLAAGAFLVAPTVPASITVALVIVGAVLPSPVVAWVGILVLAVAQLANPTEPSDPRLYGALALVHLLHVTAGLASAVDPRGRMQARILIRPLRRWLLIQVPAQAMLVLMLTLTGASASAESMGSVIATAAPIAAALAAAAALLLVVRIARRR